MIPPMLLLALSILVPPVRIVGDCSELDGPSVAAVAFVGSGEASLRAELVLAYTGTVPPRLLSMEVLTLTDEVLAVDVFHAVLQDTIQAKEIWSRVDI